VIIGIDGASTDLSLALALPDGAIVDEAAWTTPQRQSAELLPRLLELMERHRIGWDGVTALAAGTGPGSFTGLRVALALAKGLAVALGRPIVGVPSLPAWLEAQPDAAAALARAGAREAYLLTRGADGPALVDRDAVPGALGTAIVVAPADLALTFGLTKACRARGAAAIARSAAERLAGDPGGDDVRRLEPLYLRAPRGVTADGEGRVKWL
jgi:tRNA threonylcarbamoyl adenosine modification protein YeaZ